MGFTGEQALHSASEHYSAPGTAGTGQQEPCRGGSSTRQLHGAVSKHSHAAEASGNTVWGEGGGKETQQAAATHSQTQGTVPCGAKPSSSGAEVAFSHLVPLPGL